MFDHEKLRVYQYSFDFTEWVGTLLDEISPLILIIFIKNLFYEFKDQPFLNRTVYIF